jgi:hypothetical protein
MIILFVIAGGFHKLKDTNRIIELVGRKLRPLVLSAWAGKKARNKKILLNCYSRISISLDSEIRQAASMDLARKTLI